MAFRLLDAHRHRSHTRREAYHYVGDAVDCYDRLWYVVYCKLACREHSLESGIGRGGRVVSCRIAAVAGRCEIEVETGGVEVLVATRQVPSERLEAHVEPDERDKPKHSTRLGF